MTRADFQKGADLAWMDGALESEIEAIRKAMQLTRPINRMSTHQRPWRPLIGVIQLVRATAGAIQRLRCAIRGEAMIS
jgi:hypothetical protein